VFRRAAAGGLALLALGTLCGIAAAQDVTGLVGQVTSTVDATADSLDDQVDTLLNQSGSTATQTAEGSITAVGGSITAVGGSGGSAVGGLTEGSGSVVGSQTGAGTQSRDDRPPQRVSRFRAKPDRFKNSGPERKRTTLIFWLARSGKVEIVFQQVSPDCRVVGSMTVRGHRGRNRVPWDGTLEGKPLPPGTYRVLVRAGGGGSERRVARETIVIVPQDQSVEDARPAPSTCGRQKALSAAGTSQSGGQPEGRAGAVLGGGATIEDFAPQPFGDLPPINMPEGDSRSLGSIFFLIALGALSGLIAAIALIYGSKYINNQWNPFRRRYH
jgi:hypothetical protein